MSLGVLVKCLLISLLITADLYIAQELQALQTHVGILQLQQFQDEDKLERYTRQYEDPYNADIPEECKGYRNP